MSAHLIRPGQYPRGEVLEDLDNWAADMTDPVIGPEGGIETVSGGAGWWGTITGDMDGRTRTIHPVHIFHGRYSVMVLLETYDGDEAAVAEFMDALRTVEFTAPAPVEGRHGAPTSDDGRWHSYCDLFSAEAQPGWAYSFETDMDSTEWACPEDSDYLGGWVDLSGDSQVHIAGRSVAGMDEAQVRSRDSVPSTVGETLTTPNGYDFTLVENTTLPAASGGEMTRVVLKVVTPEGSEVVEVAYYVPLGAAGTAMILASARDGDEFDTTAIEAFAASVSAEYS
jgi:hypothetical protein